MSVGAGRGGSKGQGNRDKMPTKTGEVACSSTASGQASMSRGNPGLSFDPCTQLQAQDPQWEDLGNRFHQHGPYVQSGWEPMLMSPAV